MRILIVDDSALYRKLLTEAASSLPDASVVAVANGDLALSRITSESFDIVFLDVFMVGKNGPEVLQEIRAVNPRLAVVMVSGATGNDADTILSCLANGAVDFIIKPSSSCFEAGMDALKLELRKVTALSRLRNGTTQSSPKDLPPQTTLQSAPDASQQHQPVLKRSTPPSFIDLILVGVSTGGPKALSEILSGLSEKFPVPILIVQHMPLFFTQSLAAQLSKNCKLVVKEAPNNHIPLPGQVLIAPGGNHLEIFRNSENKIQTRITSAPPVNSCRPSVDVLFESAAKCQLRGVLCMILTGMGSDGANGVASLKKVTPTWCITQNAATCAVYGMPQAIEQRVLHDEILPLNDIAARLNAIFNLSGE